MPFKPSNFQEVKQRLMDNDPEFAIEYYRLKLIDKIKTMPWYKRLWYYIKYW
jgi:hypothetical protein